MTLALAPPVFAQSVEDRIISELVREGFTDIRRSRTFLGRVRIVAVGNGVVREIVLNPSNGLILRDYSTAADRSDGGSRADDGEGGTGGGREDDDDDDDDDGDDDDGGDDDD